MNNELPRIIDIQHINTIKVHGDKTYYTYKFTIQLPSPQHKEEGQKLMEQYLADHKLEIISMHIIQ
jgi:arginine repressor